MTKNESITIKPLQNGYLVSYEYRKITDPAAADRYDRYEYVDEKSMFKTWDEAMEFVATLKLEIPPATI